MNLSFRAIDLAAGRAALGEMKSSIRERKREREGGGGTALNSLFTLLSLHIAANTPGDIRARFTQHARINIRRRSNFPKSPGNPLLVHSRDARAFARIRRASVEVVRKYGARVRDRTKQREIIIIVVVIVIIVIIVVGMNRVMERELIRIRALSRPTNDNRPRRNNFSASAARVDSPSRGRQPPVNSSFDRHFSFFFWLAGLLPPLICRDRFRAPLSPFSPQPQPQRWM